MRTLLHQDNSSMLGTPVVAIVGVPVMGHTAIIHLSLILWKGDDFHSITALRIQTINKPNLDLTLPPFKGILLCFLIFTL